MVDAFMLDTFEVTVGRFRAFVSAGLGTQAHPPSISSGASGRVPDSGWRSELTAGLATDTPALRARLQSGCATPALASWTDVPGAREVVPINCVDWFTAFAFCTWDGGRLATEAEWNFAAAGGAEQRVYPWSVPSSDGTIDATYASFGCFRVL